MMAANLQQIAERLRSGRCRAMIPATRIRP